MSEEKEKKGMKKSTKAVLGLAGVAALVATGYTVAKRYLQQNELDDDDYVDDEDEVEFMSHYDELEEDFSDYGEDEELMDAVEHISKPAIKNTSTMKREVQTKKKERESLPPKMNQVRTKTKTKPESPKKTTNNEKNNTKKSS